MTEHSVAAGSARFLSQGVPRRTHPQAARPLATASPSASLSAATPRWIGPQASPRPLPWSRDLPRLCTVEGKSPRTVQASREREALTRFRRCLVEEVAPPGHAPGHRRPLRRSGGAGLGRLRPRRPAATGAPRQGRQGPGRALRRALRRGAHDLPARSRRRRAPPLPRHPFATWAIAHQAREFDVQYLLGHGSPDMVQPLQHYRYFLPGGQAPRRLLPRRQDTDGGRLTPPVAPPPSMCVQ